MFSAEPSWPSKITALFQSLILADSAISFRHPNYFKTNCSNFSPSPRVPLPPLWPLTSRLAQSGNFAGNKTDKYFSEGKLIPWVWFASRCESMGRRNEDEVYKSLCSNSWEKLSKRFWSLVYGLEKKYWNPPTCLEWCNPATCPMLACFSGSCRVRWSFFASGSHSVGPVLTTVLRGWNASLILTTLRLRGLPEWLTCSMDSGHWPRIPQLNVSIVASCRSGLNSPMTRLSTGAMKT